MPYIIKDFMEIPTNDKANVVNLSPTKKLSLERETDKQANGHSVKAEAAIMCRENT